MIYTSVYLIASYFTCINKQFLYNNYNIFILFNIMNPTELLTHLNRRYATKTFDPNKKLSDEQMDVLLESLRLSPSSFGLQWQGFVVVKDTELRKSLLPYARNQSQVVDASHLIVLCRRTDVGTDFVNHYVDISAQTKGIEVSVLDGFKKMMLGFLEWKSTEEIDIWLGKQVYIAQGFLLSACAMLEIDACPMEWFDTKKCNEILWLKELNLASCVMVPVGFRSDSDHYAQWSKVRFAKEEVVFVK